MTISNRAKEAVIGSFVADAATMGLHWIYDTSKIDELLVDGKSPEFFEPPSCPYYEYKSGRNSPWGDEMIPTLEYLATHKRFKSEELQEALYNWSMSYDGRLNELMKHFQENYEKGLRGSSLKNGAENIHAHPMCKAAIFAAFYGGLSEDDYIANVTEIVMAGQVNELALDYGVGSALFMRRILEGSSIKDSIDWLVRHPKTPARVVESIKRVDDEIATGTSARDAVQKFGPSCKSFGAFEGSMFFLKTTKSYTEAIKANILAGGDNCSRSMFIGAAFAGSKGIPAGWKDKTRYYLKIASLLCKFDDSPSWLSLPEPRSDRVKTLHAKEAVIGSFIADAATMGLHWIYDTSKIDELLAGGKEPAYFEPPSCPYYTYSPGRNSPWGEEMIPTLKYLATHKTFKAEELQEALYNWSKSYDGRLNELMNHFQENYEKGLRGASLKNGAENIHAHPMCKAPIFAAFYGGLYEDDYIAKVKEIVIAGQVNELALDYGVGSALLMRRILDGYSIDDSIEWLRRNPKTPTRVLESIQKVDDEIAAGTSARDAVQKFGASCKSFGAFEGSMFFLKTTKTYTEAIKANILAGGDNCSRSMLIGAAYAGSMGIPDEWKDKSRDYIEVAAMLQRYFSS